MRLAACLLVVLAIFSPSEVVGQSKRSTQEAKAMREGFERIRKDPQQFKDMVLMLQMALGHLGYGVGPFTGEYDEQTKRAVAKFKSNRDGKPSDGELDGETAIQILDGWKATSRPDISLPGLHVFTEFWDSYVSAKGTLVIEGQEQGIPLQTTEIECRRQWGVCIAATAMLRGEDYLSSWIEVYEVERWDEYELGTKPRDLDCVRYTLRINRRQKSVTGRRTTISASDQCKGISKEDFGLRLEDGTKALEGYRSKKRESFDKYMQIRASQSRPQP